LRWMKQCISIYCSLETTKNGFLKLAPEINKNNPKSFPLKDFKSCNLETF